MVSPHLHISMEYRDILDNGVFTDKTWFHLTYLHISMEYRDILDNGVFTDKTWFHLTHFNGVQRHYR